MTPTALALHAAETPDAPALDDGDRLWSYAELHAATERMARRLSALGAGPGDVVALIAHPDAWAVQAIHAVPRTGAILVPLNPGLGPAATESAMDALAPSMVLTAGGAASEAGLDPVWTRDLSDLPRGDAELPESSEAVYRIWTSGTGGHPKVVDIGAAHLEASARAVARRLDLTAGDRWYASLSPAHIGGLALVHRAAHVGSVVVAGGRFDVARLDALIEEGRVTHASLVPTQLLRLLDRRAGRTAPPSLRCLLVGGAAAPADLLDSAVAAGLPVALTYGLTEATSQVATATPEQVAEHPGSVGFPLDGLEVRLTTDGEILVRGATVVDTAADEEGWLHTGDLGRIDDLGRLRVTGRTTDRIISGGVNVDPVRVEEALRRVPGVVDAGVVGLPDPEWGERVVAAVATEPTVLLHPEAVLQRVRESLAVAERPRALVVVQELPRNANGKVDRAGIRSLFSAGPDRGGATA